MENIQTRLRPRQRAGTRLHWIAFVLILLAVYLVDAAAHTDWVGPAGHIAVPAVIGYFIVRKGPASESLTARYVAFAVLLTVLVGIDVVRASDQAEKSVKTGCLERNPWVAQLPRDQDRQSFCGCLAERLKLPAMRKSGLAFLTFREPTPVREDPVMVSIGTDAANQCAAMLPAV